MTTEPKVADLPKARQATAKASGSTPVAATFNVCAKELKDALSRQDAQARDAASPWQLPFATVQRVVRALTQFGVAVPESSEEQSAKAVKLIELLCDEIAHEKLRVQPEQQGAGIAVYRALERLVAESVNPGDGGDYEDGEWEALDLARAALAARQPVEETVKDSAAGSWPFVESPCEFAARMTDGLRRFDMLGAVRHVLIENPPEFVSRQPVDAAPQGCDACDRTGIRQNDEGRNICCPDCDMGRACAGDTRQPVGQASHELFAAARDFYNETVGDPNVRISCESSEQRDVVTAAGERLRAALVSPPAQDNSAIRLAGAMLANCAFNLAQRNHFTDSERQSLDESRKAWDAAIRDAPPAPKASA